MAVATFATSASAQVPQESIHPGLSGQALIDQLRADYAPAQTLGYDIARDSLYRYLDTARGTLVGAYGGYSVDIPEGEDPSSYAYQSGSGISAEHTWPQSKGAGDEPQRSDMHALYPVKQTINSARSNHPFAEITDADTDGWYYLDQSQSNTPTSNIDAWSESDGSFSSNANYSGRFEPREDHKGNAARAMFYFWVVHNAAISDANFFDAQRETLIAWHNQDEVDMNESDRSTWIATHQGTENPFVRDTTLVRRIFEPTSTTPSVQLLADASTVLESDGFATLIVELNNPDGTAVDVDVAFNATSSSASAADFGNFSTETVSFSSSAPDGATQSVTVPVTDDTEVEPTETGVFDLQNLQTTGDAVLSSTSSANVDIKDDDGTSTGSDAIFAEAFDDATQYTITTGSDATDGTSNYFTRTDGSNINKTYSGVEGSFFAGQDIDDGQVLGSTPGVITWSGISIDGATNLQFSAEVGEVLDGPGDIDDADFLLFEYRIDGGTWQPVLAFENDGSTYNTSFLEDTDFDGTGDGTSITSSEGTMTAFTKAIPETGSTLDLRFTASVNSGDEDFAIDQLEVTGDTAPTASPDSDLVIAEIMQNPSDVSDSDGEYFEVFNPTASDIDMNGWTIADTDIDAHTIASSVVVPSGEFAVFCRSTQAVSSSACTYVYDGLILSNSADELILQDAQGTEIDRVEYDGGPDWPDPTGAAMVFTGVAADDNAVASNWTTATSRENLFNTNSGSDLGSPGTRGSDQSIGDLTTIPVEMAGLTANVSGRDAILEWSTFTETNNAGFFIDHSVEGSPAASFREIGFVEGARTSTSSTRYVFRAADLDAGRHTFRLRQRDLDGTETVVGSVDLRVLPSEPLAMTAIAPHPVREQSTLRVSVQERADVTVALYDLLGRRVQVLHEGGIGPASPVALSLDASTLPSGTYFLRATGNGTSVTQRLTVVR